MQSSYTIGCMGLNFHSSLKKQAWIRQQRSRRVDLLTALSYAGLAWLRVAWPRRSLRSGMLCELDPDPDFYHVDDHIVSANCYQNEVEAWCIVTVQ